MDRVINHPLFVFLGSFALLWLGAWLGAHVLRRHEPLSKSFQQDFGVILAASLTLLGLIIGFTFSMATSRYDLRKSYEEAEANAIGTEYLRADFLPSPYASKTRDLLKRYTNLRMAFYTVDSEEDLIRVNGETSKLQGLLWDAVRKPVGEQALPAANLVVSGMNDVLNSQGYTQAAWWNRIPVAAWILMFLIAVLCNLMLGFGTPRIETRSVLFLILPLVVATSFFLIADIDSPRGGIIKVTPQNLASFYASLR